MQQMIFLSGLLADWGAASEYTVYIFIYFSAISVVFVLTRDITALSYRPFIWTVDSELLLPPIPTQMRNQGSERYTTIHTDGEVKRKGL